MPYIKQTDRPSIDKAVAELAKVIHSTGSLNYAITKLLLAYVNIESRCYMTYNEVIGVLECAKQEFYRREIINYEEQKISEHGDVFIRVPVSTKDPAPQCKPPKSL